MNYFSPFRIILKIKNAIEKDKVIITKYHKVKIVVFNTLKNDSDKNLWLSHEKLLDFFSYSATSSYTFLKGEVEKYSYIQKKLYKKSIIKSFKQICKLEHISTYLCYHTLIKEGIENSNDSFDIL